MVGGRRSRGCRRCRERKVNCDLQRPACGHCVRRKEICEPHEGTHHFILYDDRRCAPRNNGSSTQGRVSSHGARFITDSNKQLQRPPQFKLLHPEQLALKLPVNPAFTVPSCLSTERAGIISQFVSVYSSRASEPGLLKYKCFNGQPGRWLTASLELLQQGKAPILEKALTSLSLTLLGHRIGDSYLLQYGRNVYQEILKLFYKRVELVQKSRRHEDIRDCLILSYACMKIEFFGNRNVESAYNHAAGFKSFMELCDPSITQDPILYHVICEFRISIVATHVSARLSKLVCPEHWWYTAWMPEDPAKQDQLQIMMDEGFVMANIRRRFDTITFTANNPESYSGMQVARQELTAMLNVYNRISSWLSAPHQPEGQWVKSHLPTCKNLYPEFYEFKQPELAVTWLLVEQLRLSSLQNLIEMIMLVSDVSTPSSAADMDEFDIDVLRGQGLHACENILNYIEGFFSALCGFAGYTTAMGPFGAAKSFIEASLPFVDADVRVACERRLNWCRGIYRAYEAKGFPMDAVGPEHWASSDVVLLPMAPDIPAAAVLVQ